VIYINFKIFTLINKIRYILSAREFRKRAGNLLFDDSSFYRLNIGCGKRSTYGYINIDDKYVNKRVFVFDDSKMPLSDSSVKYILADSNYFRDKGEKSDAILKEWSRVMVSCGIVALDNSNRLTGAAIKAFTNNGFNDIFSHLNQGLNVRYFIYKNKKLDYHSKCFILNQKNAIEISLKDNGGAPCAINDFKLIGEKPRSIKLKYFLEYLEPHKIEGALLYIKDFMEKDSSLFIEAPNEQVETDAGSFINFFDKCNLSLLITNSGFYIDNIEISGDNKIIVKASIKKNIPVVITTDGLAGKRICALGQYLVLRFNHLGFHWEGVPQAFTRLGMESLLIESMRNWDTGEIKKAIESFRPDYLLFSLKENFSLVQDLKPVLKDLNCKVIFWYCDPDHPQDLDMSGVIDTMFLSNRGQIGEYKKAYNLDRVYYMPQGCSPYSMHYIPCEEIYDIGFSGAASSVALHETRRRLFGRLNEMYKVKIRRNVRNNISEFYSQSKMVFGGSDFDYELYTSNRFFIALGCGACYVTKRFKGIELLAENKKHLLWFETQEELFDILDHYLSHDSEREKIRRAAEKLALEKHTYADRVKNILDITEEKTSEFRGFL